MFKIMFVCHGNICRSPMAEYIMKDLVEKENLSSEFCICSRATSTEEIGNPVYPSAKAELERHGIFCDNKKRAAQVKSDDYKKYDMILVMDRHNLRNISYIFPDDKDKKIHKLLEFAGCGDDIADPWYTERFDIAFNDIYKGCTALLEKLKKDGIIKDREKL